MIDRETSACATPPFAVLAIDHVVLRAQDADAMVAFYRDAIGCAVVREKPDLGLTHLDAGSALIDIIAVEGPLGKAGVCTSGAYGRNVDHVCLRISSFDYEALRAHFAGFGIDVPPPQQRFGAAGYGYSTYLTDPEGNGIELRS